VEVARDLGLSEDELRLYGPYKAKVHLSAYKRREKEPDGKLILVTAITPTRFGEGKTTTTIGLGQALGLLRKRAAIAIREPSLGPVFGIKGGATGGGRAQVVPSDDINLHFTGDFAAVEKANNLLAALIDNHLHHGNELGLDPREIHQIAAASEVMAILALARDLRDLKGRFGRILVGFTRDGRPVLAKELKAPGPMAALMRDAVHPNLVQTLEGTPAFVHAGPFGNIATGTSSVIATRMALKLADYVVTEAGFATDLGAEKFFDIKCRVGELQPAAAVLVATVRALKLHGGAPPDVKALERESPEAVERGLPNLEKHIENVQAFGVPLVVAVNRFPTDTDAEIEVVRRFCEAKGVEVAVSEVYERGGEGGLDLAEKAIALADSGKATFRFLYEPDEPLAQKIETIAKTIYGADGVEYTATAKAKLHRSWATAKASCALPRRRARSRTILNCSAARGALPSRFGT